MYMHPLYCLYMDRCIACIHLYCAILYSKHSSIGQNVYTYICRDIYFSTELIEMSTYLQPASLHDHHMQDCDPCQSHPHLVLNSAQHCRGTIVSIATVCASVSGQTEFKSTSVCMH